MTTTTYSLSRTVSDGRLTSRRGAAASIVLLLAVPLAIIGQIALGLDSEVLIHFALATGTLLIASSVFDFATPRWQTWAACTAGIGLGAIFFLQGLAPLLHSATLGAFAYSRPVGGWGEMVTMSIVMAWFAVVARAHTQGVTRVLGTASALLVIGMAMWSITFAPETGMPQELRLLFALPIIWFLFVTTRRAR